MVGYAVGVGVDQGRGGCDCAGTVFSDQCYDRVVVAVVWEIVEGGTESIGGCLVRNTCVLEYSGCLKVHH